MKGYITCIDCGEEVERRSSSQKRCSDCKKKGKLARDREASERYRTRSPEAVKATAARYRARNKESIAERKATYRSENRGRMREKDAKYYAENRKRILNGKAVYYIENRTAIANRKRRYYDESPESARERSAERYAENREEIAARKRRWALDNPHLVEASKIRTKERDAALNSSRSRSPWTAEEDAVVMSWTDSLRELGATLKRSPVAVKNRRQRLRKRAAEQAASNKEVKP